MARRPYGHARCVQCSAEYRSDLPDALCPRCQAQEDRIYANDAKPDFVDLDPPSWTRAAMRERLGVSGDVDE